jgi:two-component system cell cycle response regulator
MATLLVIEDSAQQRAEVRAAVEESAAFDRILEAEDGLHGLKLLLSEPVDVVLCDLELPGLDGEKLLRMRTAARGAECEIPFLFLSATTDYERRARLLRGGASDSITKPFHRADLMARLELHLKLVRLQRELLNKNKLLEQLSTTDPLTGLRNRRYLTEVLAVEFLRAKRYNTPLAVVMADIDHFKLVNDRHGHATGDSVLEAVGGILKRRLRGSDHGGRYGGEEFLMVLANADEDGAGIFAERLRQEVEETALHSDSGTPLHVTLSLGVAAFHQGHQTPGDLVSQADEALYRAKQAGRNRVANSKSL